MSQSNYHDLRHIILSYDTAILLVLADGRTIGNVTRYSATTSRHQQKAGAFSATILLADVPMGSDDLRAIAEERGLL